MVIMIESGSACRVGASRIQGRRGMVDNDGKHTYTGESVRSFWLHICGRLAGQRRNRRHLERYSAGSRLKPLPLFL